MSATAAARRSTSASERVDGEARAQRAPDAEALHQRLGAVMPGADRDAPLVEQRGAVVRVDPLDVERDDRALDLGVPRPVHRDAGDRRERVEALRGDRLLVGGHARHAELVEVLDGGVEADGGRDRRRARLEAPRQVVPLRVVDPDLLDHLAAAPGRLERLEHRRAGRTARRCRWARASCGRRTRRSRRRARAMSSGRCGTAWAPSTSTRAPAACARRVISATGLIVPSTLRHVRERDHARARRQQPVERGEVEVRAVEHRHGREPRAPVAADHLPRDQVRVVLHLGDEDLVARLEGAPDRLGDEVDALGGAAREDRPPRASAAPMNARTASRAALVELGRLLAERVDRPVHVGVAPLVVARHRLQHRPSASGSRRRSRGTRAAGR